ncbi:major_cap_HK97, phage major capsid protein, HK97 family [uncultured Caudovirales phage]|uniref:Major_cap_HK97, phage major capsid protein, HK97 family n=1 Tax=uncultured Caudovirales phage TaxID=2100421 RepID=A0A6J5PI70_9CAUD|nr:major_cap_HK97, phage major capsid protein, HK97 family [uncultured Caudovirales phage]
MSDIETRQASIGAVEGKTITGYAALYNSWSQPLMGAKGTFTERIAPGAFDASIAAGASLWFMHDSKQILANTKSGTLTLESDAQGLKYTAVLGSSERDAGVLDLIARGVVSEMSFGFSVPPGGDSWVGEKRTLNAVNLREISIVEQGAYKGPAVQVVRSQETPVITKVIKPMNIRTMNAKLAELRAQNVEGTEVENRAEIVAQIEEILEARDAAMAAADGIREAATPIQRTIDRRDQRDEWRNTDQYRDQWMGYMRGGRQPEVRAALKSQDSSAVMIPKLYEDMIMKYIDAATVVRNLAELRTGVQGYQTLRYNTLETNAYTSAWTVSDAGTQASTEINPAFAEVPLTPAACLPYTSVTKQLLAQANFDVEAEIVDNLMRQFARNLEFGYVGGLGTVGTNGATTHQPVGLFTTTSAATVKAVAAGGATRATAITASITIDNLREMRYKLLPASYWNSSAWVMSQDVYAAIAGITVNGVPLFTPSSDAVGVQGGSFTLLGLPVYVTEFAPTYKLVAASGVNTMLICGNVRDAFSAREWSGMNIDRDALTLAGSGQVKFQGTMFANSAFTRAKAIVQLQVTAS